ncbi:MAG: hypothetical protein ACOVJ8_09535, partial [Sediminibacterium sp.]
MKISKEVEGTRALLNKWGKEKVGFVFLIDFECIKPCIWKIDTLIEDFKFDFNGFSNTQKQVEKVKQLEFERYPESFEIYKAKFEKVKQQIEYGNSFLVNLTIETPIRCNLSIAEIFENVASKYSCWLKDEFVCFSP